MDFPKKSIDNFCGRRQVNRLLSAPVSYTHLDVYKRQVVDGLDLTQKGVSLLEVRKKVGLVFQYPEYQLFEETVAKDIAFGPRNMGLDAEEIDRRVRGAMLQVGLNYDEVAERSPFEDVYKRQQDLINVLHALHVFDLCDDGHIGAAQRAEELAHVQNVLRTAGEGGGDEVHAVRCV